MKSEKLIIVGGVAAGTKAAAKAKRENPDLEVLVLTEDTHISYAGCGLPYYMGGVIRDEKDLVVRGPAEFRAENDITVKVGYKVLSIDPATKTVKALNMNKNVEKEYTYDKLILATGASPVMPPVPGIKLDGVFSVRRVPDALTIRKLIEDKTVQKAVVVGGGFIGLEVAENLCHQGVRTTLIELADHILPGFDREMALWVQREMEITDLSIITGEKVEAILDNGEGKVAGVKAGNKEIPAQLVVWATGVRPNVELAKATGIELGPTGAIKVNSQMETNIPDIFAVGDCAENINRITGKPAWYPMGSTANKMGRVAALKATGDTTANHVGVLGTTVVKFFHVNAAKTGLSERDARNAGCYDVETIIVPSNDKAHYMPGHETIITKLIIDKSTGNILGGQIVGKGQVDKPIDILVTAITFGAKVDQLGDLDLAYAPPFSQAMASTIVAANVLMNKLSGRFAGMGPLAAEQYLDNPEWQFVDVRPTVDVNKTGIIPGSIAIPWDQVKKRIDELDKSKNTILVCVWGKRAYGQVKAFKKLGFEKVYILEGGITAWPFELD